MKRIFYFIIAVFFAFSVTAGEMTREPQLRLNTQMHYIGIRDMDFDASGKFILTAGWDKMAKLWDAKTGELIRTYRVPIDKDNEGRLNTCAITSDGQYVLLAGNTGYTLQNKNFIYIFNASTGEMLNKIGGFDYQIIRLKFSRDGKYLACSLGEKGGVKIIETKNWKMIKELSGYEDNTRSLDFDKDGRLATVCHDKKIRLYDKDFFLIKEEYSTLNNLSAVSFSPDGTLLAVGSTSSKKLEVLDGKGLNLLYAPDMSDLPDWNSIQTIGWSNDGSSLFVGGFLLKSNSDSEKATYLIRKFSKQGKGSFQDYDATGFTTTSIKILPDDSIAYGSFYPDWGIISKFGKRFIYNKSEILNYAYATHHLIINSGTDLIGFQPQYMNYMTFDLLKRELKKGKPSGSKISTKNGGLEITNWNSRFPKLNGTALDFLDNTLNEFCRSASITPDGKYIMAVGQKRLYCLDNKGNMIWNKILPVTGWNVNATDVACIVAIADGTLRWYRITDGEELLALFVNSDQKRWVLWTPSGYYDCSPGGQELIGWHLNNGSDKEANFYPISKFSEKYYRPDVISLVLKNLDEAKALAEADSLRGTKSVQKTVLESLPPTVNIISPETNTIVQSKSIEIEYTVSTPDDSPVTEIKVLVNGRPAESGERGLKVVSKNQEKVNKRITVQIGEGEQVIALLAKNGNGYSEPAKVKVIFGKKISSEQFVILPKLYVLAIGISNYENRDYGLKYAAKDANDFAQSLANQKGRLYREVVTKVLTDASATKDNILDGLDWLQKQVTSKDVAMLFIAGHGINDNNGKLYYLPVNAQLDNMKKTCIRADEITETISAISGKVIYFMDTCHSGNIKVASTRGDTGTDLTGIINELTSSENGAIVFCSSSGKQYSLESDEWKNGAFTKALIEGIAGAADYQKNGSITINELDLFISDKVKELTKGRQTPVTAKPDTIRDFPIAVK